MTLELRSFTTKVKRVEGLQLTADNLSEAAALSGGEFMWSVVWKQWVILLTIPKAGRVYARPGMWLIKRQGTWVAMTDQNFRHKYAEDPDTAAELLDNALAAMEEYRGSNRG